MNANACPAKVMVMYKSLMDLFLYQARVKTKRSVRVGKQKQAGKESKVQESGRVDKTQARNSAGNIQQIQTTSCCKE